jgi:hypothetical protein
MTSLGYGEARALSINFEVQHALGRMESLLRGTIVHAFARDPHGVSIAASGEAEDARRVAAEALRAHSTMNTRIGCASERPWLSTARTVKRPGSGVQ